jgi:hypothetical protein
LGLIITDFANNVANPNRNVMSTTTLNRYYPCATTTLSEISLENEQLSVIKVPLSLKDEPFILTIPETGITEEGCNVNGRLFDERTTP